MRQIFLCLVMMLTPMLCYAGKNVIFGEIGEIADISDFPSPPLDAPLVEVDKGSQDYQLLGQKLREFYGVELAGCVNTTYTVPKKVIGNAVERLFPGYRFYVIFYVPDTRNCTGPMSMISDGEVSLVIDPQNKVDFVLDVFGKLLSDNKLRIENASDANLVWHAFCETLRFDWYHMKHEKINDRLWRLGLWADGPSAALEIHLDQNSIIQSVEMDKSINILHTTILN